MLSAFLIATLAATPPPEQVMQKVARLCLADFHSKAINFPDENSIGSAERIYDAKNGYQYDIVVDCDADQTIIHITTTRTSAAG
jgi:hypothetical protein